LVLIALVNTIISLYYYLLVVKAMFFNTNDHPVESIKSDVSLKISLIICTIAILVIGGFSVVYQQIALLGFGI